MLNSIKTAVHVRGRKNIAIARDVERSAHTVNQWLCGSIRIPIRARAGLETAIGAQVDWQQYEVEFSALDQARKDRKASAPQAMPIPPAPAPPPPTPETPAKATNMAATAPRRLTATPPAQKPAPRPAAPPKAPAAMPPARKGLLTFLFADDGELL